MKAVIYLAVSWLLVLDSSQVIRADQSNGSEALQTGNFKAYRFHSLLTGIINTAFVTTTADCGFSCLETEGCLSFNIQAQPDFIRGHRCELLNTSFFLSPPKFQENGSFHHYAIQVSFD